MRAICPMARCPRPARVLRHSAAALLVGATMIAGAQVPAFGQRADQTAMSVPRPALQGGVAGFPQPLVPSDAARLRRIFDLQARDEMARSERIAAAVALFNQGGSTTTVSTTAAAIGKSGSSFTLRDAWTNATSTTTGAISASVPAHGTVVYRVSGGGTVTPPTTFRLRSESSGRCLDVDNSGTTNGTGTLIWDCHSNANQQFSQDGQALRVLGKCLEAPNNAAAGTRTQIWDCTGGANQRWSIN